MGNSVQNSEACQEPLTSTPRFQISIKGYLALMNVVLLCLLFPAINYFLYSKAASFRDVQLEKAVAERTVALERRAAQLLRTLSHSGSQAIAEYNFTFLNSLADKAVRDDPELISCQFFSNLENGEISAGMSLQGLNVKAVFDSQLKGISGEHFADEQTVSGPLPVSFTDQELNSEDEVHLLLGRTPVFVGGKHWGWSYAAFSMEQLCREIERDRQEWGGQMHRYKIFFLSVTGIFFVLGLISTILFTGPLVRSIHELRDGVDRVARGDLGYKIRGRRMACAEFASLANSFNGMTDSLRLSRQQLDTYSHSLEDKVEERTRTLQEVQDELVNQAHEAGMAEMAVGVLHNIGNAITPAKVGAQLLAKQLANSPLRTSLKSALEPMMPLIDKASGLPEEEKQYLLNVINLLPGSLVEEYDQAIEELDSISEKHRYIEKVILLQMHYAKLKGYPTLIDCNHVIKDALKILNEGLRQYKVQIEMDLQPIPKVRLEEGKLLQVMVNLIKNGYEAMAETDIRARRLRLSSNSIKEEVVLTVEDSGCGFSEEVKEKMFTFGYSSKDRGSGFGLHSCANYLIANNGAIKASSKGPGQGACFVIRLPAAENEERG